jgi:Domain of unknown function (DUF222)/HNH endonuclease
VCDGIPVPGSVSDALAMLDRALDYLNTADVASLPVDTQAQALRSLETAEAKHTTARAALLSAFSAGGGPEADGHGAARVWLRWQTRITRGAAAGAVAWMRRLAAHPVIEAALARGELSASWARELCAWSDRLPAAVRDDADRLLGQAAAAGADLADLGRLAEAIYQRTRGPDEDGEDGFGDRYFHLGITFSGAGRAQGDLTAGCAAALSAVLDALGKKAGPEDTRTAAQRRHDALEDACRRLIATGMLPGRGGQPTQVQVHLGLAELRDLPGAAASERAWVRERTRAGAAGRGWGAGPAAAGGRPGWLTGAEAQAAACDATIVPVVTGHVDWGALDRLTGAFAATHGLAHPGPAHSGPSHSGPSHSGPSHSGPAHLGPAHPSPSNPGPAHPSPSHSGSFHPRTPAVPGGGCRCGDCTGLAKPPPGPVDDGGTKEGRARLARALLGLAIDALSGPGGLATALRAGLADTGLSVATPLTSVSLPLDIGAGSEAIPAHLRRAVTLRHPHCAFPGCGQPASVCDVHHLVPRAAGGATALQNLVPLCRFHHLIAIHHWGWTLRLNPDATTTAISPDGRRVWHSHGPPGRAA